MQLRLVQFFDSVFFFPFELERCTKQQLRLFETEETVDQSATYQYIQEVEERSRVERRMDNDAHPDRLRFNLGIVLLLAYGQCIFSRTEVGVLDAVVVVADPFIVETFQHIFVGRFFQCVDIIVRVERDDQVVLVMAQIYFRSVG